MVGLSRTPNWTSIKKLRGGQLVKWGPASERPGEYGAGSARAQASRPMPTTTSR